MDLLPVQLARLEDAQLVRPLYEEQDPTYLFKHALTQASAYDSLLIKARREIHRRVAEAYEALYPGQLDRHAAVLTLHYAEAGDDRKTFTYAVRAGELAATLSAFTEAQTYFTLALDALARLPDTLENQRAFVDTIIKQANVGWGITGAEQNLARLFHAEALAQTLPESDRLRLARVRYWIARIYSYRNEHRAATSYYDKVLADARVSNDDELFGMALALGGRTFFLQGYFGKAVPLLTQALAYLERRGDWQEWILTKVCLAIALAAQGHYHEGYLQGEGARHRALALNIRSSIAIAHLMSARVELMAGDIQRMLDEVRVWTDEVRATNPLVYYMALGFQAWGESRLGMNESARASMAAADAIAPHFGSGIIFDDWFAAARAEIELNAGEIPQALRLAAQAVDRARETGGVFSEGLAHRVWAQALLASDPSDYASAQAHFESSLELFRQSDAVIEAARTHVVWGKIRIARGDPDAARQHLEQAAAQFSSSGLENELAATRAVLDALL